MIIDNLILEITRKCNFSCEHCLRGNAQNKEISFSVIDALFENNIEYISLVTFTGGEPSLNIKAINYFIDKCIEKCVEVGSFYIATNGGKASGNIDFLQALIRLYCFCSDNEGSQVEISNSDYHASQQDAEAIKKLKCLSFVSDRQKLDSNYLIPEGKAKNFNTKREKENVDKELKISEDDRILNDEFYINCKGDILLNCDLSFIRQAKNRVGNILKDKIKDIAIISEE
jgi:organic radical activating enzyme